MDDGDQCYDSDRNQLGEVSAAKLFYGFPKVCLETSIMTRCHSVFYHRFIAGNGDKVRLDGNGMIVG